MKQFALFGAVVFGALGGYLPMLFGDIDSMMVWSIFTSMIGGLVGVWLGVKLYRSIN